MRENLTVKALLTLTRTGPLTVNKRGLVCAVVIFPEAFRDERGEEVFKA